MKKRKWYIICFLAVSGICMAVIFGTSMYKHWQEENSGIPDVVSTVSKGEYRYLTLVANSNMIEDKKEFARKVIGMCQKNSFHSVKFSTDIDAARCCWEISVY